MSRVAFLRDSEDPDVVVALRRPGRQRRPAQDALPDHLADIGAVSPDTLTPWKEELLWRLYVDTYNRLTSATPTN